MKIIFLLNRNNISFVLFPGKLHFWTEIVCSSAHRWERKKCQNLQQNQMLLCLAKVRKDPCFLIFNLCTLFVASSIYLWLFKFICGFFNLFVAFSIYLWLFQFICGFSGFSSVCYSAGITGWWENVEGWKNESRNLWKISNLKSRNLWQLRQGGRLPDKHPARQMWIFNGSRL